MAAAAAGTSVGGMNRGDWQAFLRLAAHRLNWRPDVRFWAHEASPPAGAVVFASLVRRVFDAEQSTARRRHALMMYVLLRGVDDFLDEEEDDGVGVERARAEQLDRAQARLARFEADHGVWLEDARAQRLLDTLLAPPDITEAPAALAHADAATVERYEARWAAPYGSLPRGAAPVWYEVYLIHPDPRSASPLVHVAPLYVVREPGSLLSLEDTVALQLNVVAATSVREAPTFPALRLAALLPLKSAPKELDAKWCMRDGVRVVANEMRFQTFGTFCQAMHQAALPHPDPAVVVNAAQFSYRWPSAQPAVAPLPNYVAKASSERLLVEAARAPTQMLENIEEEDEEEEELSDVDLRAEEEEDREADKFERRRRTLAALQQAWQSAARDWMQRPTSFYHSDAQRPLQVAMLNLHLESRAGVMQRTSANATLSAPRLLPRFGDEHPWHRAPRVLFRCPVCDEPSWLYAHHSITNALWFCGGPFCRLLGPLSAAHEALLVDLYQRHRATDNDEATGQPFVLLSNPELPYYTDVDTFLTATYNAVVHTTDFDVHVALVRGALANNGLPRQEQWFRASVLPTTLVQDEREGPPPEGSVAAAIRDAALLEANGGVDGPSAMDAEAQGTEVLSNVHAGHLALRQAVSAPLALVPAVDTGVVAMEEEPSAVSDPVTAEAPIGLGPMQTEIDGPGDVLDFMRDDEEGAGAHEAATTGPSLIQREQMITQQWPARAREQYRRKRVKLIRHQTDVAVGDWARLRLKLEKGVINELAEAVVQPVLDETVFLETMRPRIKAKPEEWERIKRQFEEQRREFLREFEKLLDLRNYVAAEGLGWLVGEQEELEVWPPTERDAYVLARAQFLERARVHLTEHWEKELKKFDEPELRLPSLAADIVLKRHHESRELWAELSGVLQSKRATTDHLDRVAKRLVVQVEETARGLMQLFREHRANVLRPSLAPERARLLEHALGTLVALRASCDLRDWWRMRWSQHELLERHVRANAMLGAQAQEAWRRLASDTYETVHRRWMRYVSEQWRTSRSLAFQALSPARLALALLQTRRDCMSRASLVIQDAAEFREWLRDWIDLLRAEQHRSLRANVDQPSLETSFAGAPPLARVSDPLQRLFARAGIPLISVAKAPRMVHAFRLHCEDELRKHPEDRYPRSLKPFVDADEQRRVIVERWSAEFRAAQHRFRAERYARTAAHPNGRHREGNGEEEDEDDDESDWIDEDDEGDDNARSNVAGPVHQGDNANGSVRRMKPPRLWTNYNMRDYGGNDTTAGTVMLWANAPVASSEYEDIGPLQNEAVRTVPDAVDFLRCMASVPGMPWTPHLDTCVGPAAELFWKVGFRVVTPGLCRFLIRAGLRFLLSAVHGVPTLLAVPVFSPPGAPEGIIRRTAARQGATAVAEGKSKDGSTGRAGQEGSSTSKAKQRSPRKSKTRHQGAAMIAENEDRDDGLDEDRQGRMTEPGDEWGERLFLCDFPRGLLERVGITVNAAEQLLTTALRAFSTAQRAATIPPNWNRFRVLLEEVDEPNQSTLHALDPQNRLCHFYNTGVTTEEQAMIVLRAAAVVLLDPYWTFQCIEGATDARQKTEAERTAFLRCHRLLWYGSSTTGTLEPLRRETERAAVAARITNPLTSLIKQRVANFVVTGSHLRRSLRLSAPPRGEVVLSLHPESETVALQVTGGSGPVVHQTLYGQQLAQLLLACGTVDGRAWLQGPGRHFLNEARSFLERAVRTGQQPYEVVLADFFIGIAGEELGSAPDALDATESLRVAREQDRAIGDWDAVTRMETRLIRNFSKPTLWPADAFEEEKEAEDTEAKTSDNAVDAPAAESARSLLRRQQWIPSDLLEVFAAVALDPSVLEPVCSEFLPWLFGLPSAKSGRRLRPLQGPRQPNHRLHANYAMAFEETEADTEDAAAQSKKARDRMLKCIPQSWRHDLLAARPPSCSERRVHQFTEDVARFCGSQPWESSHLGPWHAETWTDDRVVLPLCMVLDVYNLCRGHTLLSEALRRLHDENPLCGITAAGLGPDSSVTRCLELSQRLSKSGSQHVSFAEACLQRGIPLAPPRGWTTDDYRDPQRLRQWLEPLLARVNTWFPPLVSIDDTRHAVQGLIRQLQTVASVQPRRRRPRAPDANDEPEEHADEEEEQSAVQYASHRRVILDDDDDNVLDNDRVHRLEKCVECEHLLASFVHRVRETWFSPVAYPQGRMQQCRLLPSALHDWVCARLQHVLLPLPSHTTTAEAHEQVRVCLSESAPEHWSPPFPHSLVYGVAALDQWFTRTRDENALEFYTFGNAAEKLAEAIGHRVANPMDYIQQYVRRPLEAFTLERQRLALGPQPLTKIKLENEGSDEGAPAASATVSALGVNAVIAAINLIHPTHDLVQSKDLVNATLQRVLLADPLPSVSVTQVRALLERVLGDAMGHLPKGVDRNAVCDVWADGLVQELQRLTIERTAAELVPHPDAKLDERISGTVCLAFVTALTEHVCAYDVGRVLSTDRLVYGPRELLANSAAYVVTAMDLNEWSRVQLHPKAAREILRRWSAASHTQLERARSWTRHPRTERVVGPQSVLWPIRASWPVEARDLPEELRSAYARMADAFWSNLETWIQSSFATGGDEPRQEPNGIATVTQKQESWAVQRLRVLTKVTKPLLEEHFKASSNEFSNLCLAVVRLHAETTENRARDALRLGLDALALIEAHAVDVWITRGEDLELFIESWRDDQPLHRIVQRMLREKGLSTTVSVAKAWAERVLQGHHHGAHTGQWWEQLENQVRRTDSVVSRWNYVLVRDVREGAQVVLQFLGCLLDCLFRWNSAELSNSNRLRVQRELLNAANDADAREGWMQSLARRSDFWGLATDIMQRLRAHGDLSSPWTSSLPPEQHVRLVFLHRAAFAHYIDLTALRLLQQSGATDRDPTSRVHEFCRHYSELLQHQRLLDVPRVEDSAEARNPSAFAAAEAVLQQAWSTERINALVLGSVSRDEGWKLRRRVYSNDPAGAAEVDQELLKKEAPLWHALTRAARQLEGNLSPARVTQLVLKMKQRVTSHWDIFTRLYARCASLQRKTGPKASDDKGKLARPEEAFVSILRDMCAKWNEFSNALEALAVRLRGVLGEGQKALNEWKADWDRTAPGPVQAIDPAHVLSAETVDQRRERELERWKLALEIYNKSVRTRRAASDIEIPEGITLLISRIEAIQGDTQRAHAELAVVQKAIDAAHPCDEQCRSLETLFSVQSIAQVLRQGTLCAWNLRVVLEGPEVVAVRGLLPAPVRTCLRALDTLVTLAGDVGNGLVTLVDHSGALVRTDQSTRVDVAAAGVTEALQAWGMTLEAGTPEHPLKPWVGWLVWPEEESMRLITTQPLHALEYLFALLRDLYSGRWHPSPALWFWAGLSGSAHEIQWTVSPAETRALNEVERQLQRLQQVTDDLRACYQQIASLAIVTNHQARAPTGYELQDVVHVLTTELRLPNRSNAPPNNLQRASGALSHYVVATLWPMENTPPAPVAEPPAAPSVPPEETARPPVVAEIRKPPVRQKHRSGSTQKSTRRPAVLTIDENSMMRAPPVSQPTAAAAAEVVPAPAAVARAPSMVPAAPAPPSVAPRPPGAAAAAAPPAAPVPKDAKRPAPAPAVVVADPDDIPIANMRAPKIKKAKRYADPPPPPPRSGTNAKSMLRTTHICVQI